MPSAVIIPTYNESDNISRLITDILALPLDIHVVVVDDNSPDGTGAIVDGLAARDPRVHIVHRPGKLGLGTAHIAGMRKAMALNLEPLITSDADFSHDPRYIPDLLKGLTRYDVVIGSRYVKGGGMKGRDLRLRVISWSANFVARTLLGLRATDCTAGFRAYRRAVIESLDLNRVFSNGYSFLIEMLFLCQRQSWRIGEIPIVYQDRRAGTSKISKNEVSKAIYTVLRLFVRRWRLNATRSVRQPKPDEQQP